MFTFLLLFNVACIAEQDITGTWETVDQYGYGYMSIESMDKGKVTFYSQLWANGHVEVELTNIEKTENGFSLKMELITDKSAIVDGRATLKDESLCLKVLVPEEPNLMCFVRPETLNQLRKKPVKGNEKAQ